MITIRIATKEDAGLIADLSRQTFYDAFAAQNTRDNMDKFMNEQFSRERLMAQVAVANNIFLLAFSAGQPVGYACLAMGENPEDLGSVNAIELARIYSVTHAIGKGVGKALMQECLAIAKRMQKEIIWLGVWEHNARAIEFYRRWGFEKFSSHIFIVGDDSQTDWLMKKSL